MSDEKQKENFSSLDQAIDTLSDLLTTRQEQPPTQSAPEYDEQAVPVLSDIVVPEDELQQAQEPPILQSVAFTLVNEEVQASSASQETPPEESGEAPMATEELLRELEGIVDHELEKVTRSARESILDSLKTRLDARQEGPLEEVDEDSEKIEPVTPEHAVYLPMSNWKKDEDEDVSSLPLFTRKQDD